MREGILYSTTKKTFACCCEFHGGAFDTESRRYTAGMYCTWKHLLMEYYPSTCLYTYANTIWEWEGEGMSKGVGEAGRQVISSSNKFRNKDPEPPLWPGQQQLYTKEHPHTSNKKYHMGVDNKSETLLLAPMENLCLNHKSMPGRCSSGFFLSLVRECI